VSFEVIVLCACLGQQPEELWCHERSEQERARVRVDALVLDPRLCDTARWQARRVADGWRDSRFGSMHSEAVLSGRAPYREVCAMTISGDPVTNWCSLPSVGHREVVLGRRWQRCGFGHASDGRGRHFWIGLYAE
jgi:hypothetical protein